MINVFIGYDPRESICFSVCSHSILKRSTQPVSITPLNLKNLSMYKETHIDGSTEFTYSRFLVPYLMNYQGWAIFLDLDTVLTNDITELWNLKNDSLALSCVKHEYQTNTFKKFLGKTNNNYPRKNWSSVMLFNCSHPKNRILTPEFIQNQTGSYLHQFSWLDDNDIGDLPKEWNWLPDEYGTNDKAKLIHYTLGSPCFEEYKNTAMSEYWFRELDQITQPLKNF